VEFEEVYRDGRIPWDIGEPQPALAEVVAADWCVGDVLDAGCGTGELALALAARGHRVLGVDFAPSAIAMASSKAAERGLRADFQAADITTLDGAFDTVLDSGLLHCLSPEDQERYLAMLNRTCRDRAAILCFADRPGARTPEDRGLTEARLRDLFADWTVEELVPAEIFGVIEGVRTPMSGWRLRARR
jgi:cyclopropane fatty-acyl-phospholipid synthase-like methyltransferase